MESDCQKNIKVSQRSSLVNAAPRAPGEYVGNKFMRIVPAKLMMYVSRGKNANH